ncbi:hypothetical protein IE077_000188 [Cardiosporidium cionae]|uniref:snRNA-activating protein complex subunit 3 n=1 Tax=Cardiosporidium cionae TaxID=476202 RepID=A0ABQ7JG59_9APIC|nr:hypothetical protein IE077_000188 [Cardiosporidium cionae]|eukprot:KAF8822972.1 hypothetical protein IE077_000188 [Cardiosporidium cionae]
MASRNDEGILPEPLSQSSEIEQTREETRHSHSKLVNNIPFPLPSCDILFILGEFKSLYHREPFSDSNAEKDTLESKFYSRNDSYSQEASAGCGQPFKAVSLAIPDDLRNQWLNHSVPPEFPKENYFPTQFLSDCEAALQRLFAINPQKCTEIRKATIPLSEEVSFINKKITNIPSSLLEGVRMPDVREMIDEAVSRECENWDQKLSEDTRLLLEKFRSTSKAKSRKFNRFACKIGWAPIPKDNPWSEANLLQKIRQSSNLKSVELVYNYNNTRHINSFVSRNFAVNAHKRSEAKLHAQANDDATAGISEVLQKVQEMQAIITVDFFHPVRGHKMASVDILGSQTLADLRDAFECSEDYRLAAERFSVRYNILDKQGSVFFIGGILYADTRDPKALDYSVETGQFLRTKNPGKLRSTYGGPQHLHTLNEICIPLNQHCAFLHQGDCEHRVAFTSIRKFNALYDSIYLLSYPLRIYKPSTKIRFCDVCSSEKCTWLVFNSEMFTKNPTALCGNCARFALHDKRGELLQSDVFVCSYSEIS